LAANAGAVIRNHVDFQIEIVPADGIRAAILGNSAFGTTPISGQLSVEMISVDRVLN
jgi:hypothetical protein